MPSTCPACHGDKVVGFSSPRAHRCCESCGHRWSSEEDVQQRHQYYAQLKGRNTLGDPDYEKKMADRLADIAPLLRDGLRVLEIGCAEGDLGRRIKALAKLEYVGIELSDDAQTAMQCLDRVSRVPASELADKAYDLILSFHVLEHIADIRAELGHWRRLLKPAGWLILEVPNQAGHTLLSWDANAEHLHQFTAASLTALLSQSGFDTRQLTSGHFESVVYSDSLRVQACAHPTEEARRAELLARFRAVFAGPFVVYGIGGDFRNYVAPLLADLAIAALVDSASACHGQVIDKLRVEAFDAVKFAGVPVLITSLRYQAEITAVLEQQGVPPQLIHGLSAIYG